MIMPIKLLANCMKTTPIGNEVIKFLAIWSVSHFEIRKVKNNG